MYMHPPTHQIPLLVVGSLSNYYNGKFTGAISSYDIVKTYILVTPIFAARYMNLFFQNSFLVENYLHSNITSLLILNIYFYNKITHLYLKHLILSLQKPFFF